MNFKGMYARLALKKEPVNRAAPRLISDADLARATEAFHKASKGMAQMGVGASKVATNFASTSSFDYVECGVVRRDGSHGFGSLHSFRSGYRRCSNPILERGWVRCGRSGPWLQEFGGVS